MRDDVSRSTGDAQSEGPGHSQPPDFASWTSGARTAFFGSDIVSAGPARVPDDVADPVRDTVTENVSIASGSLHGIRDRFALLAESSLLLAESLDYETTLATVAGMALPYLGAWCIVDLTLPDNGIRRVAVLHPDPARQLIATELHERYPPRPNDLLGAPHVIKTGRSEVVFDVSDAALQRIARDANHLRLLRAMGVGAYLIVPMRARNRVIGAITFVTTEAGRRFGDLDVMLARDLASRAALAVDNARTHAAAIAAQRAAESAEASARAEQRVAEEVGRRTGDLLAFVSHELRTPLGAVGAFAELLALTAAETLSEKEQQYLKGIRRNQRHLIRLADDVVHYAQGASGMVRYTMTDVELAAVLRNCEDMITLPCREARIALHIDTSKATLRTHVDEQKLQQILSYLITHACKRTGPEGCVSLSCRDAGTEAVEVVVVDSGPGIAADQIEHLFEPFVQASEPDVRRLGGVGLGLAISRTWARSMHGDLTASSMPGEGCRLTLTLPRVPTTTPRVAPT